MGTRVIIEPEYQDVLRIAGLSEYDDFMRRPSDGPPASSHRDRETVPIRIQCADETLLFFLKRTFRVPIKHVWKDLAARRFPHGQPWREWEAIGALQLARIPVMRRVAVGERRSRGLPTAGFLLVAAAGGVNTVADWLRPGGPGRAALSVRARHHLIRELGRLQGRMRQAGFLWPDAHPRHIYAEPDENELGGWRFCVIDVERVIHAPGNRSRFVAPLPKLLQRALPYEPTRIEQLAFVSGLDAALKVAYPPAWTEPESLLAPHSHGVPLRAPEVHDRSVFPIRRADGFWMAEHDAPILRAAGIASSAALYRFADGHPLTKNGLDPHRLRMRVQLTNDGEERVYFLKRVTNPPLREQLNRVIDGAVRDSSAWREWHFIRRLTEIGVPTMRAAALAADMQHGWERRSALLTAQVPGESLERWVPREWSRLATERRRALLAQVAAVARVMHAARLFHRDFYLAHLFVDWQDESRPVIYVIDLARMLERPRRSWRWQIKDLAALHHSAPMGIVSKSDRVRFLRMYAQWIDRTTRGRTRHALLAELVRAVEARAVRMRRHDRRRGRA